MPIMGVSMPNTLVNVTGEVDASIAAALLTIHNNAHVNATGSPQTKGIKDSAPKHCKRID